MYIYNIIYYDYICNNAPEMLKKTSETFSSYNKNEFSQRLVDIIRLVILTLYITL